MGFSMSVRPVAWLRRGWQGFGAGRLAKLGLLAVLIGLPGFALWGAAATYRYGAAARQAIDVSNAFEQARYGIGQEELLERKYRLEPSPAVQWSFDAASAGVIFDLERARQVSADATKVVEEMLPEHARYLDASRRMFAAIDAHDAALTERIDEEEGDPAFDALSAHAQAMAAVSRVRAALALQKLGTLQTGVAVATPIVFAAGLALVVFFWRVMRNFEAAAGAAREREAEAIGTSERRFRALVQNSEDMVLISDRDRVITYQSPAAEGFWNLGAGALLGHNPFEFVHPDDAPAIRMLSEEVRAAPGMSGTVELRIRDGKGVWRSAEAILTNLLEEPAVRGVVTTVRDIGERKAFEEQLTRQAFHDPLTTLPNRALFRDRLAQALAWGARLRRNIGLLVVGLDNFKLINDGLGHEAGDRLLKEVAARLQSCLSGVDTAARLGGDEFALLLEHVDDEAAALTVIEMITAELARPFTIDGHELVASASIGVAFGAPGSDPEILLRNADLAMFRAKSGGKGRHAVFDAAMHTDRLQRLELEADLRRAIEQGTLAVHYQPIVRLASGATVEVEALARWQHPTRGTIPPSEFIPIAEESGLILPLGRFVLREACRQTVLWHREHPAEQKLVVGVNLSPRQFQQPDLAGEVAAVLAETGLPAHCLKLEITEGTVMQDVEATITTLWQLKALGVQLAIDDFGTGYSSLAYLKKLPLDVLKIDRSFVQGIGQCQEDTAIVQATLSLAKSLGLTVTGEGIETAEQAELLSTLECERGQGYLFSRPIEASAFGALLRESRTPAPIAA